MAKEKHDTSVDASQSMTLVPFHGDALEAVRGADGDVWVVLKRVCENLGIVDYKQAARLKREPWATTTMMVAVAADGKNREVLCLHLDSVPMWLATIEASRIREAVRPKLVAYQKECARVLRDHFFGRSSGVDLKAIAVVAGVAAREAVAPLYARMDRIEGVIADELSARRVATDNRMAAMHARTIGQVLDHYDVPAHKRRRLNTIASNDLARWCDENPSGGVVSCTFPGDRRRGIRLFPIVQVHAWWRARGKELAAEHVRHLQRGVTGQTVLPFVRKDPKAPKSPRSTL